MADRNGSGRGTAEIRREIEAEREELARAVDSLRDEVAKATDVVSKVRANLPLVAAGALGVGFFLAGGVGATARFFARKSREGDDHVRMRLGRYSVVD
jgi:hypothetical protein